MTWNFQNLYTYLIVNHVEAQGGNFILEVPYCVEIKKSGPIGADFSAPRLSHSQENTD